MLPRNSVRQLAICLMAVSLFVSKAGDTTAQGQLGPQTDASGSQFVYPQPIANAGLVEVYLGVEGKYIRTTALRLDSYDLSENGKNLTISLKAMMSEDEKTSLEKQMEQDLPKIKGAPTTVKGESLVWITPHSITVTVCNPDGKIVGKKTQENKSANGVLAPLTIDAKESLPFSIPLDGVTVDRTQLGQYKYTIEASYVVKTVQAQTASFQVIAIEGFRSVENVLGGKPKQDDYISREATQCIQSSTSVKRAVQFIDSNPDDEKLCLQLLQQSLTREVTLGKGQWETLPEKYFIWTPALGRLEVAPRERNFEENEKSLKESSKKSFASKVASLREDAHKFDSFDKWYNEQRRKRYGEGAGSVSTEAEADVLDVVSGGGSGSASYSFKNDVDNLDVGSGERKRYEDLYAKLQKSAELQTSLDSMFDSYWKGKNTIVDREAKQFRLAAIRDMANVSNDLTVLHRVRTSGVTTKTFKSLELPLKAAMRE